MTSNAVHFQRLPASWFWILILTFCLTLLSSSQAHAAKGAAGCVAVKGAFCPNPFAPPPPMPPQFDITGFIQEATLDSDGSAGICKLGVTDPRLAGGTVKVNGITVVIPCNTILQMPAATLTWQELFSLAPRDMGLPLGNDGIPTQTGLAIGDSVPGIMKNGNSPLPSYEIHVQGNVVNGTYIAGLVFISQQNLNISQGVITAIDYENAELQIAVSGPNPGTARVRINDPLGRYGKSHGALNSHKEVEEPNYDQRFSIDEESPTIHAATGYPMCIPRTDPFNVGDDPNCPQANRPRAPNCQSLPAPFPGFPMPADGQFCSSFMMPPTQNSISACTGVDCQPDPNYFAPFEVGDFIDFSGTLKIDSKGTYISAHTIDNHVGIYTTPGIMPAYLGIEMELQGTGGQAVNGMPQESTSRVKIVGFSTDPTNLVDIYAIDNDPATGAVSERLLGTANPSGPPVIGRFKFAPNTGPFLPPTRELRVVSRTLCGDPSVPCALGNNAYITAGGLSAGQYHAPNFEFIFAENLTLGAAVVPANMQEIPFLFCGSGPLTTPTAGNVGPMVHQLDPAPWASPMLTPFFKIEICPGEPSVQ